MLTLILLTLSAQEATFQTGARLVVEAVTVKDKKGKPIEGLTQADFALTEDGKPQTIAFVEAYRMPEERTTLEAYTASAVPVDKLARVQIAPSPPAGEKDKRLLTLYFDMPALPGVDQLRALRAAQKFIREQMTTADLIAILQFADGYVQVLQDFTADRAKLLTVLQTLAVGEEQYAVDPTVDNGAAFGQNDAEFNIFKSDRQLAALQTAVRMLAVRNEKKALLYFASGLRLNGVDNQAQLQATVNAAIRSGVAFWPVDARGLVADAPMGGAGRGSPGGVGMYHGTNATSMAQQFQRSQDTLYALAADTGGKALLDNNDLTQGIKQAQQSITSYYLIGYYTSNQTLDGKFRRIKITLTKELAADLDYRQGYYAGREYKKFSSADKERQLEEALMQGDPLTELTLAAEINYFQLNSAEYFVPVALKIPGSELVRAQRGGAERTVIDFIGEIREFNSTVSNVRDKVDVKLSERTAAELARSPVTYETGFTLLPGKYTLKILARDTTTGRIGTYLKPFVIPNLAREKERLPISSVVLSSQSLPMSQALYSAKDKAKAQEIHPLVQNGEKLIPSVTRVFSKAKDLHVYLQAYQAGNSGAVVAFYRDQRKVWEAPLAAAASLPGHRAAAAPLRMRLALDPLDPGEYLCQVTVMNPEGQKAAFWQAPVLIVP